MAERKIVMTNANIILAERFRLMKQGIIRGTGEIVTIEENGEKKQIEMPEEIHTYSAWKSMGYQVKRGEKAIAQFSVWKYRSKRKEGTEGSDDEEGTMFMQRASWFTVRQVEAIAAK